MRILTPLMPVGSLRLLSTDCSHHIIVIVSHDNSKPFFSTQNIHLENQIGEGQRRGEVERRVTKMEVNTTEVPGTATGLRTVARRG